MILQSIFVVKCLGTKRTLKSFHIAVSGNMSVEWSSLCESVPTNVTLVWKRLLVDVFNGLIKLYSRVRIRRQQIRESDRSQLFGIRTWNNNKIKYSYFTSKKDNSCLYKKKMINVILYVSYERSFILSESKTMVPNLWYRVDHWRQYVLENLGSLLVQNYQKYNWTI